MTVISRRTLLAGLACASGAQLLPAFGASAPLPPVRFVEANGIRMAVYEAGRGQTVFLLHGFPELAYTWRRQIPAIAAAGYRVIVPDMRGFGLSDCPREVEQYALTRLTGDLVGVMDALDIREAVFVGHDWGGVVAWQMPLSHRDRVAGVVGVNTPHIPHFMLWLHPELTAGLAPAGFTPDVNLDPIAQMRQVYHPDMYVLMIHDGDVADRALAEDPTRAFTSRRRNVITIDAYRQLPAAARQMAFFKPGRSSSKNLPGESILYDDEISFYVESFGRTGFTPALNWYRNLSRNWKDSLAIDQTVRVPALMIAAEDDVIMTPGMTAEMGTYVPDLEKHVIADCGHWTPEEKPDELNRIITDWLKRRFPT